MKVADFPILDDAAVSPHTSLSELSKLFLSRGLTGVAVVDVAGHLVGMVTVADLVKGEEKRTQQEASICHIAGVGPAQVEPKASDMMTRDVVSISSEASVVDALEMMLGHHIRRLVVMNGESFRGILTVPAVLEQLRRTLAIESASS